MPWFSASIIMYVKFKDGNQNSFPFFENIILIEVPSKKEASEKAMQIGKSEESDYSGSFTYDERPAEMKFGGIRKIFECECGLKSPNTGTEVGYSKMAVRQESDFKDLIAGLPVKVDYIE